MKTSLPVTVVVSQWPGQSPARQRLEADLITGLAGRAGLELCLVPHLYDLTPEHAAVQTLRAKREPLVVLAWLYPRATRWLLHSFGIDGRFCRSELDEPEVLEASSSTAGAPSRSDAGQAGAASSPSTSSSGRPTTSDPASPSPERPVCCIRLRPGTRAQSYVDAVLRLVEQFRAARQPEQLQTAEGSVDRPADGSVHSADRGQTAASADQRSQDLPPELAECPAGVATLPEAHPTRRRWFPVIDYDRCTHCMECLDFCLFGVYGVTDDNRVVVEEPDNCRPGCPACARVCPDGAILFPAHKNATIAGGPGRLEDLRLDLSEIFSGDLARSAAELAERERRFYTERAANERLQQAASADGTAQRDGSTRLQTSTPPADELDRLIDQLDELDL